ncbi:hypothetical protein L2E82_02936 [Cichorium intybus]|uniref:Uncharacterized protein n=1 Tax=Cichorium intybus TaxID=13427 RepID=A0ACB9H438_CICIN|nr:hypothetical protein L2E82_02936 [Cichorium intybus]
MRRPEVMGSSEMVNAVGLDRRLLVTLPVQSKWQNSNWWSTFKKREGGKEARGVFVQALTIFLSLSSVLPCNQHHYTNPILFSVQVDNDAPNHLRFILSGLRLEIISSSRWRPPSTGVLRVFSVTVTTFHSCCSINLTRQQQTKHLTKPGSISI